MKNLESSTERSNTHRFDLLVDGELNVEDRRQLLAACESDPTLWRRCALAFLEAQAWRVDFRAEPGDGVPMAAVEMRRRSAASRIYRYGSALAVCATVFFFAGWLFRPIRNEPVVADSVIAPRDAASDRTGSREDQIGPKIDSDGTASTTAVAEADGIRTNPSSTVADPGRRRVAGILTLKVDDRGSEREIKLPIVDIPEAELVEWAKNPVAVNSFVVKALERRGHKVEAQRQLVTLNLDGGQKLVLPVEHFDLRLAHRIYQ